MATDQTVRLTVAQAVVRFLANQWSARDGEEHRLVAGCFGIFGHGNVAGLGQALLEHTDTLPYYLARNEQAMVHTAVGYARTMNRLATFACTTSIGPGATNLVTGAALATVNRLPVLLLPGDIFATRVANPVLQELEDARSFDVSVNDCLRPVSRFWDRVNRPEQLPSALLAAMRVLTDPADTGAVTLALPQDVQAEAHDWPVELFDRRVWHVARPQPDPAALERALAAIRAARRPLLVAGGGVKYAAATEALRRFADRTGVPVAETQAGRGVLPWDHPCAVGAVGATGTQAANALAGRADVVIGVGTRYGDFTTASHTLFAEPSVRFVNVNVTPMDAAKLAGVSVLADARAALGALAERLDDWQVDGSYTEEVEVLAGSWRTMVDEACARDGTPLPQTAVIGVLNETVEEHDVVVNAAGSMPGDLHRLWRAKDPWQYHVEYGYSCMGYEIPAGLGIKLAAPTREVFVLIGDGSYLMLSQEIVTAVAEGVKLVVVLVDNGGFASIGALSETVGAERFGTRYLARHPVTGQLDGQPLPVDLAANAASLGADVLRAGDRHELQDALVAARAAERTTVVHVPTDLIGRTPDSGAWWDVPVAEVATREATRAAYAEYEAQRKRRRIHL